jgi:hypothetical protein
MLEFPLASGVTFFFQAVTIGKAAQLAPPQTLACLSKTPAKRGVFEELLFIPLPVTPPGCLASYLHRLTAQTTRANGNLVSPSAAGEKTRLGAPFGCHSLRRREPLRVAALPSRHAGTTQYRGPRKTYHVIGPRVAALPSRHAGTTQYRGPRKTYHVIGPQVVVALSSRHAGTAP